MKQIKIKTNIKRTRQRLNIAAIIYISLNRSLEPQKCKEFLSLKINLFALRKMPVFHGNR